MRRSNYIAGDYHDIFPAVGDVWINTKTQVHFMITRTNGKFEVEYKIEGDVKGNHTGEAICIGGSCQRHEFMDKFKRVQRVQQLDLL